MAGNEAYGAYLETLQEIPQKKKQPVLDDNTFFFVSLFVFVALLLWIFL
ncbi:hypothetical protein HZC31_04025 [Candidatus Woesearchaeota archaeon]|nr:hypothetical protein [Candidatus Woesearchaeota archaeon]